MLAIGRPIVSGSPCVSTRAHVDQIVVSVGPYMFQSSSPSASSWSASATGSASPPHSAFNAGRPAPARVEQHPPGRRRRLHDRRAAALEQRRRAPADLPVSCAARSRRRAPTISGRYSSSPAMSNDSVVTATSTSSAPSPGRCAHRRRGSSPARGAGSARPSACPVEPDV